MGFRNAIIWSFLGASFAIAAFGASVPLRSIDLQQLVGANQAATWLLDAGLRGSVLLLGDSAPSSKDYTCAPTDIPCAH